MTREPYLVVSFYKFVELPSAELSQLQAELKEALLKHDIKGSILLAPEGINAMLSGFDENMALFISKLKEYEPFADIGSSIKIKESRFSQHPFGKSKVRLKKEIVSLGKPDFRCEHFGPHLEVEEWNELLKTEPELILLDTRNDYEVEIGTFKGALNPAIDKFKDLPAYLEKNFGDKKDKPFAIFCTGGIRCDKLSSYMLSQGCEKVYQLKNGILEYLEASPQENLWQGSCFVFDERFGLQEGLKVSQ